MTVITLSTVGYSEVGLLSFHGSIFAIVFIISSFLGITLAVSLVGEHVLNNWSLKNLKLKKTAL